MPEIVSCNLCGSQERTPQPRKSHVLNLRSDYTVCRCDRCQLLYLSPRPSAEELAGLYRAEPYYSADNATRGAKRLRFYDAKLQRLEKHKPRQGRLLGIGCLEGGYALDVAQKRGWQVVCVDFVDALVEHARSRLQLEIRLGDAWDLSVLQGETFDAIYGHSFEHVPDPRKTLRQCLELLKPDGILMLEVPNQFYALKDRIKSLLFGVLGRRTLRYFHGEVSPHFHLYYFSRQTLCKLLSSEGFEVLELRTYLPRHPVYLANPRALFLQELSYLLGAPFGMGPTIEVICRRR